MSVDREKQALEQCIREAGRVVYQMAREGFETARKANQDPVTTADLAADRILREGLLAACPGTEWLSEETRDRPERLAAERVWIVDPIDGTKEFVSGIPEYAVSVALVERGTPILGAVFNPATDELYLAARGQGVTRNGQAVRSDRPLPDKPVILASRSEVKRGEWDIFRPLAEIRICGSIAYKLALVAAAQADSTFSLGPKNEWDIAAGILLVMEAGGYSADKAGKPYVLNQANTLVNGIVASTRSARELTIELVQRYPTPQGRAD